LTKPAEVAADEADAPILIELRSRLDASVDPIERSALRIRQGLYLARTNRLPQAEALPAEIRSQWAGQEALRVYVWLWILEGVLTFYRHSSTHERSRLLQAYETARLAAWRPEAEIAAAWLAHFAYVDSDYEAMSRWLLASGLGTAALEESIARSSLTLACALQLLGEEAQAGIWFGRSREIARRTGDRAGIMAATANRLMLKLSENWLNHVFEEPLRHEPEALRQELMGILGYERLSGSESLTEQNEVARLRLAVLRGETESALDLARSMSAAHQRRSAPSLGIAHVIEAWLLSQRLPQAELPALWASRLASFAVPEMDDDDAAGCRMLMARVAERAGEPATAERLRETARQLRAGFLAGLDQHRTDLLAIAHEAAARWHVS
jgi:hypothetical protein